MFRSHHRSPCATQTPMAGRILYFFLVLASMVTTWPAYAAALSVADVIRLAQTQDPDPAAARAAIGVAEAERVRADLYANPSLSWDREHFPGGGASGGSAPGEWQDAVLLTIPLDFSTRRSARHHLAEANVAVFRAAALHAKSQAVTRALGLFYGLVAENRRATLEKNAAERLAEAARVVKRRKEEGNVSGYDHVRIEIETQLATSAWRQTEARAARLGMELALLLGVRARQIRVVGDLEADSSLVFTKRQGARPSLQLLHEAQTFARQAHRVSRWNWIPPLSLSAGPLIGHEDQTRYGYAAGLSFELPIFSRGQALAAEAQARKHELGARALAAKRSSTAAGARAQALLKATRQEATRFDEATREHLKRLERAAESGYREGRLSIAELLDAHRAHTTVQKHRLMLALSIKQAEVALRAARGDFE